MVTAPAAHAPIHRLATTSFILAIVSLLLAWYGSLHAEKHIDGSQLREARGSSNIVAEPGSRLERIVDQFELTVFGDRFDQKVLEFTRRSPGARILVELVAFLLPLVLGLSAAISGGRALTTIEHSGGRWSGNFRGVFAILIGSFAAVIAGCMLVSVYLWPHLPSLYTL